MSVSVNVNAQIQRILTPQAKGSAATATLGARAGPTTSCPASLCAAGFKPHSRARVRRLGQPNPSQNPTPTAPAATRRCRPVVAVLEVSAPVGRGG